MLRREGVSVMAEKKDPVCGMQIEEEDAAAQTEYDGQTYYFCSSECQRKFDENPQQFTSKKREAGR